MKEYEIAVRPELIIHENGGFAFIDEVSVWLKENKVFGWYAVKVPLEREYYIWFTNTTDAMLFTLRWS